MDIYSESGRIKSLEKKFLTYQQIQKLIEVKNITEFTAITEKSFYKLSSNITSADEISEFFNKEKENFYKEVEKYAPSLFKIFLLKNDFFNLKLIAEGKENYVYPGNLPGTILKRSVEERKIEVPDFLKKGVEIVKGKKDIEEKLLNLKNEYYIQLYNILNSYRSEFIERYGKIEIDFANLSTYILKKRKDEKIIISFLIKGGNIKREKFLQQENLFKSFKSEYKIIKTPVDEENFEIERYKVIMNYLKKGRIIPYGIETIFSYFVAREIELDLIHRLFTGKFYNVETEILKKWAIPPYQWE